MGCQVQIGLPQNAKKDAEMGKVSISDCRLQISNWSADGFGRPGMRRTECEKIESHARLLNKMSA